MIHLLKTKQYTEMATKFQKALRYYREDKNSNKALQIALKSRLLLSIPDIKEDADKSEKLLNIIKEITNDFPNKSKIINEYSEVIDKK